MIHQYFSILADALQNGTHYDWREILSVFFLNAFQPVILCIKAGKLVTETLYEISDSFILTSGDTFTQNKGNADILVYQFQCSMEEFSRSNGLGSDPQ